MSARDVELRLRRVERLAARAGWRLGRLDQDLGRVAQQAWASMAGTYFAGTTPGPPPANTTFSGTLGGCASTSRLAGVALTATHGSDVLNLTTDSSGNFSGAFFMTSNDPVTFDITSPSPRFQDLTFSATLIAGGSSNLGVKRLTPSSGYACTTQCTLPFKTTLDLVDSVNGDFTLTWNGDPLNHPDLWVYESPTRNYVLDINNLAIDGTGVQAFFVSSSCPEDVKLVWRQAGTSGQTFTFTEP